MATPVYPATNNSEAIELNISNANQFFTILQGGIDDFITTYEGHGEIPSVAKALHEAAAYKAPLPWETTGEETDLLQPRLFNDDLYVPLNVPAPFSTEPNNQYWRMYSTRSAQVLIDDLTFTGDGTTTDFTVASMVVDDPAAYLVSIDGIKQRPTIDYTVNVATDTLSFTEAPPATTADNISVTVLGALRGALAEGIYESVAEGLASTFDGNFFHVVNSSDPEVFVDLYKNDSGSSLFIDSYPNSVALNNLNTDIQSTIDALGDLAFENNAAGVPYDNSGSGLAAVNAHDAIDEVNAELDAHKSAPDPHPQYVLETDLDSYVVESDLAANTGASLVGTSSGDTVEEAINGIATAISDNASEIQDLSATTAKLSGGASANFSAMPQVDGDPIVESGSNADGEWTRWADGRMICVNESSHDTTVTDTAGALFFSGGTFQFAPYSAAFINPPKVSIEIYGRYNAIKGGASITESTSNQVPPRFYHLSDNARTIGTYSYQYIAIGRWK